MKSFTKYRKSLFSKRMLYDVSRYFFIILGIASAAVGFIVAFKSDAFGNSWIPPLIGTILIFILSLILAWPKLHISKFFSYPGIRITVKVGDVLQEKCNLVIGFSDTFDTEIGQIISPNSLQGKLLSSTYNYDRERLDDEIKKALGESKFEVDPEKTKGKNKRYEIGTTIAIPGEGRKFFCSAYSKMGNDLRANSNIDNFWLSLQKIWEKVRFEGEQRPLSMPVIGSNLARIPGISYALLIKLILLSFVVNSRIDCISRELTIVISESDAGKINFLEINDYINSLQN